MNIAMAFHAGDMDQAVRWLNWNAELNGCQKHDLFLMPSKGLSWMQFFSKDGVFPCYYSAFKSVVLVMDYEGIQSDWSAGNATVRDASGPNSMLRQFAWHFHLNKLGPWFFCEPDAIPLRPDWADLIEAEYLASGKRYMGARVPAIGEVPEHSSGNMVLPQDAAVLSHKLMIPSVADIGGKRVQIAFDVAAASDILANFHETRLIQHVFRGPELTSLESIREDAAIFHTCKKGEIIPLLREKLIGIPEIKGLTAKAFPLIEVRHHQINPSRNMNDPGPGFYASKPKVYTYFSPVKSKEGQKEQLRLIELWEKTWQERGWFTHVLTEEDAKRNREFSVSAFNKIPSINPKQYENACWNRWIAMADIGGLLTDYDVMNFDLNRVPVPAEGKFPLILCGGSTPVPCAVIGTNDQYNEAVKAFLSCPVGLEKGQPHLSDMLAVQYLKFPSVDMCKELNKEGFTRAPLIHFSHSACAPYQCKRSEVIVEFTRGDEKSSDAPAKPTWIGTVRSRVQELAAMADTHSRRQLLIAEMRKLKLIPKARAR